MSVTEAELEGLGEEERAALIDDDETETEADEAADEPEAEAAADEPEQEAEAESEPEPEQAKADEPFIPRYYADPVEHYEERMQELNNRDLEVWNQFQDGDLTSEEYKLAEREIREQIKALDNAKKDEEFSVRFEQQRRQQEWGWECKRFLSDNPQFKEDVNPALHAALDANLRRLQMEARNTGQEELDPALLTTAKQKLMDAFNAATGESGRPVASKIKPKQAKGAIPPNLGDMPSAEIPNTGGDEWAHLNNLTGMAAEEAAAKLSKAEEERYLRGE